MARKGKSPERERRPAPAEPPSRPRQAAERPADSAPRRPSGPRAGGPIWLYGIHPVKAALANPARRCRRLLVAGEVVKNLGPLPGGLVAEPVDRNRLDQMVGPGAVHQGVALLVNPLEAPELTAACAPADGARNVVLVLDQVTDPHNVGAILRSAAAFGVRAVVTTDHHAPPDSATLAKSASGALELVPLVRVPNLARALVRLAELGYWRIGLDADGPRTLAEAKPTGTGSVALVLGAEGPGMRRLTRETCDETARLPIKVTALVDSLNVSNAAAVALYELAREA
ncbi:23S rRNA (guanosine(2251)-2'-O)-methyltransferase RlmB [Desertibaculum subflavum]|uniref:23S rRNA (guanosine(2251)-2'-O)-methyltransferase RlmB n=1 Tax=Desertibaculum subflavum TaxID=2268458 RepID=UPI0034D22199